MPASQTVAAPVLLSADGNQIKAAVSWLEPEHKEAALWLYEHCHDGHLALDVLASKLNRGAQHGPYTGIQLEYLFRGRYCWDLDHLASDVTKYRALVDARERIKRPDFIVTELTQQIFGVCDRTRSYNKVQMLFGDGQIGKSKGLEEYARVNRRTTHYLRLPTQAPLRATLELLAQTCRLGSRSPGTAILRSQIVKHFDSRMLLIIDELQQVTLARRGSDRLATVEFLREIYDASGCGLVLCGTNEAMQEIETGENALWLRQLRRRALPTITLPAVASDADILSFAGHFGLTVEMSAAAMGEARKIATENGIGLLITYFQGAARMAAAEQVSATWEHFLRTVKAFNGQ